MIKVNLLEGAADTRAQAKATKAAAKTTQQLLMVVGALVLLLGVLAVDYYYSSNRLETAKRELAEQQRIAEELKENRKRKDQLDRQIRSIKDRIKIIEDLQKTQRGPYSMLQVINTHLQPEFIQLDKITQMKDEVTIDGEAKSESIVADFAKGIELNSNNLFQGVSFKTTRKEGTEPVDPNDPNSELRQVVTFVFNLKAKYTPTAVGQAPGTGDPAAPGGATPPAGATPAAPATPPKT